MESALYKPLLMTLRSNEIDCVFYASYLYFDGVKSVLCCNNSAKFYLRSMLKPIQASILADDKIYDYFNFTTEELAVMQGSHTGEEVHTECVYSILKKIGLSDNNLLCPVIPPLNTKGVLKYNRLHNNCSGKHAMMLAYCVYKGLDISNYTDFNHPVQLKIREKLLDYAKTKQYTITKDGCTAPVFGLKMEDIKTALLNYYLDKKNEKLIYAYKNNPYIIGGRDNLGLRTDTLISNISPDLVSKVGAGGFIYVYNLKTKAILIVKMAQDNNLQREILALEILYRTNNLNKRYYDGNIYTEADEKIGEYVFNLDEL